MYFRIKRLFSIYVACHAPDGAGQLGVQLRMVPGFVAAGVRAFPHAVRWAKTRDPAARARVKQILDLSGRAPIAIRPELLGDAVASVVPDGAAVTIIMPVYDNLVMTREALRRVVDHTSIPWRLVLVDDASPSSDVRPALLAFAQAHPDRVHFIALDTNQGFVGAANAGLARAADWPDPVVLLNTDAYVPMGWAERLLAPIWADLRVASVTPMSNDAELGCVPLLSVPRAISTDLADRLDVHARGLNAGRVTAPAGVGFCMALAPKFLALAAQFDPVFAPGYGEEVDWCQKTAAMGGVHVYVPNLFVAHMGGQSFGSDAKARLIARNSEVLSRRYPRFDAEVFGFTRNDPLVTARLALGIAWAVEDAPDVALTIWFAHSMGGGAEIDLQRRVQDELTRRGAVVIVRFGGVFRFGIELWLAGEDHPVAGGTNDWTVVQKLLEPVKLRHVIYSNAVGDADPIEIPDFLLSLARDASTLNVLIHDYFALSPSVTLLGQGDIFVWPADPADARHQTRRADGTVVSLTQWHAKWGAVLTGADEVICFSRASAELVQQVYPALENIQTVPHHLPVEVPVTARPKGPFTIGVLGNISPHKGAAFLRDLSHEICADNRMRLVLLGQLDPSYALAKGSIIHGSYSVEDLSSLVERYAITCWLIPSIWPETFSFTTHEAIATGLPVFTFDLGAQADGVRAYLKSGGQGAVLDLPQKGQGAAAVMAAIHAQAKAEQE